MENSYRTNTHQGKVSLSIVVPSYNEEKNLEATIVEVSRALEGRVSDLEFIVINDCSTDRTAEIADRLVRTNPKVRVEHNSTNRGLGWNYRRGIELAKNEYVIMVPGDNELHPQSVAYVVGFGGVADMILPYPENLFYRPYFRQVVSVTFTAILNWISGYKIGYYNGSLLARREVVAKARSSTNGFAFQAETIVQLLNMGHTYHQVPFKLNYSSGRMTAFRLKNIITVVSTVLRMSCKYKIFAGPKKGIAKEIKSQDSENRRLESHSIPIRDT